MLVFVLVSVFMLPQYFRRYMDSIATQFQDWCYIGTERIAHHNKLVYRTVEAFAKHFIFLLRFVRHHNDGIEEGFQARTLQLVLLV